MESSILFRFLIIFCLFNCLTFSSTYSQSEETKRLLAEIEGKWQKDDNGNVTNTKIISNINLAKDSIYKRTLEYWTYNYDGKNPLVQDIGKGLIIGQGIYDKTFHRISLAPALVPLGEEWINTGYELRIDIKENSVIILLTLTNYFSSYGAGLNSGKNEEILISTTFPVNQNGNKKNKFGKAFYESLQRGRQTFLEIEKALRKGYIVENYKRGLNDQEFKKYYGNGNIKMIGFKNKNGKIKGELKYYYKNGELKNIMNVDTGEKKEYFRNGVLKRTGIFLDGGKTGEWKEYYDNGQLKEVGYYSKRDGILKYYLNDKKIGEWKYYDETGKLIKTENYN
jgi:antitoxin component YwqK of YwqJK toxin-antitoxin module